MPWRLRIVRQGKVPAKPCAGAALVCSAASHRGVPSAQPTGRGRVWLTAPSPHPDPPTAPLGRADRADTHLAPRCATSITRPDGPASAGLGPPRPSAAPTEVAAGHSASGGALYFLPPPHCASPLHSSLPPLPPGPAWPSASSPCPLSHFSQSPPRHGLALPLGRGVPRGVPGRGITDVISSYLHI